MAQLPRSPLERRVESYMNRRGTRTRREARSFRMAGELFNVEAREKARNVEQESRRRLQAERVVGVGFGEKDNYGPDNSWDTPDVLRYTPDPAYYKGHKTYAPLVGSPRGVADSKQSQRPSYL
jgi:hypothetical protein